MLEDLKEKEERCLRLDTELRHLLESLAIMLSTPVRFVDSSELSIKERIRDLLSDAKDKSTVTKLNIFFVYYSTMKQF